MALKDILYHNIVINNSLLACLHVYNLSGVFGGPFFFQPIKAL